MKKIIPVLKGDIPEKEEKGFVMNPAETSKPTIAFNITIKDEVEEPSMDEMEHLASLEDDADIYDSSDDDVYTEEEDEEDNEDAEDDEESYEDDEDDTSDDEEEEDEEDDPEDREEDFLNIPLDVSKLGRSISKISNMIKEYIHAQDVYGMISDYVTRKKYYADEFYQKVQNSIYHTLIEYCKVSKNESGEEVVDMDGLDWEHFYTLRFFDRVYNDRNVSRETDPMKLPAKYMREYGDSAYMIDSAWLELLKFRLTPRIPIPEEKINIITEVIQDAWCQVPEEEEWPCKDCSCDKSISIRPMRVSIYEDGGKNVLYISSDDGNRPAVIPFYEFDSYGNHEMEYDPDLFTNQKNGNWDWLSHFRAGAKFITNDCEKYLALNDAEGVRKEFKTIILNEEKDGKYLMGIYLIPNMSKHEENGLISQYNFDDEILFKINTAVASCIGAISYLPFNQAYNDDEYAELVAEGERLDKININYEESDSDEESDAPDLVEALEEQKSAMDVDMADIAAQFLVGDDEVIEEYDEDGYQDDEEDYEEYDSDSFEFSPIRKKHRMS